RFFVCVRGYGCLLSTRLSLRPLFSRVFLQGSDAFCAAGMRPLVFRCLKTESEEIHLPSRRMKSALWTIVLGECPPLTLAVWSHHGYIGACEAVLRVRSHISPGPYRSFRELSLAGSVDPDIWCPPTFVGNSGIECFNGYCGFALLFFFYRLFIVQVCPTLLVVPRESGASSTPRLRGSLAGAPEYWITRFRG